jgi:hypothetical protein
MSIQTVSFVFGCFLVMVAILGGGFEVKELKVPKVGRSSRLTSCLFGGLFVCLGIGLPLEGIWSNLSPAAAETVAPPAHPAVKEIVQPESAAKPAPPQPSSTVDQPLQQPHPSTADRTPRTRVAPGKVEPPVHWEQKPRWWLRRVKGALRPGNQ